MPPDLQPAPADSAWRWLRGVAKRAAQAPPAVKFVVMVGVMSFFADFTYEGSRSIAGPYLGLLGAGAFTISVISGAGSLVLGRVFDRAGIGVLVPLTVVCAAYAPLVFLGGFWAVLAGSALWGLGMGVQESLIPAAVAPMASPDRRAHAYGLFTAAYGTAWVLGSIVIGVLTSASAGGLVAFCVAAELAAIPLLLVVRGRTATIG